MGLKFVAGKAGPLTKKKLPGIVIRLPFGCPIPVFVTPDAIREYLEEQPDDVRRQVIPENKPEWLERLTHHRANN